MASARPNRRRATLSTQNLPELAGIAVLVKSHTRRCRQSHRVSGGIAEAETGSVGLQRLGGRHQRSWTKAGDMTNCSTHGSETEARFSRPQRVQHCACAIKGCSANGDFQRKREARAGRYTAHPSWLPFDGSRTCSPAPPAAPPPARIRPMALRLPRRRQRPCPCRFLRYPRAGSPGADRFTAPRS